ncbi:hypothetical protein ACFC0M_03435 [Streptomyces sp. NPDC056149]
MSVIVVPQLAMTSHPEGRPGARFLFLLGAVLLIRGWRGVSP